MINHKLLTVKASQNIIRILPPLILEEKHVDEAIIKIDKAFKNLNEKKIRHFLNINKLSTKDIFC